MHPGEARSTPLPAQQDYVRRTTQAKRKAQQTGPFISQSRPVQSVDLSHTWVKKSQERSREDACPS